MKKGKSAWSRFFASGRKERPKEGSSEALSAQESLNTPISSRRRDWLKKLSPGVGGVKLGRLSLTIPSGRPLAEACGMMAVFAWFFYRSPLGLIPALPAGYFYALGREREIEEKRDHEAAAQFMEMIRMAASNLNAGYSIENAFLASYPEMVMLFGKNALMCKELLSLKRGLENNISFEELLRAMGERYRVEDIREFAQIFSIAKKSGGRLTEIISSSVEVLAEKMEADEEIRVLLASRKYEQKIMGVIPFFILFYVDFSSRGYFDVLYGNLFGIAVMSACMAVYMVSVWWSGKISAVKI